MHPSRLAVLAVLPLLTLLPGASDAAPLGTAFSYQGQLHDGGIPANDLYDLELCLFDQMLGAAALSCVSADDVPVEEGLFATALDFGGAAFNGQQRFLELRVRPGDSSGTYTPLAPRQLIRATPEALRAASASVAPWAGLSGVPAGFADGIDNDSGGTVTSVAAGTGLTGGPISGSGTLAIADGGVDSTQLAVGAVTATKLANNAVATAAIIDANITTAKIAPGAVGSAQMAVGAVGSAQINPAQVQARISTSCDAGSFMQGVNADGSPQCTELQQGNITTVVEAVSNGGQDARASMAVPADGLPVISYYDGAAQSLKVAKCQNPTCTFSSKRTVSATSFPLGAWLRIGNDQLPVIAFRNGNGLQVAKCSNASCDATSTITQIDPSAIEGLAMAVAADGLPVTAYTTSAGSLKVAKCSDPACTGPATITTLLPAASAFLPTLELGEDGLPLIVYLDLGVNAMQVLKCSAGDCSGAVTTNALDGSNSGFTAAIAIGLDGLPIISYYTGTLLRAVKCANADCSSGSVATTVDTTGGNSGRDSAITIGITGAPLISYRDATAATTKVAQCANPACTGTAIITAFDSVGVSSIAIGSNGLPIISNQSSDALRFVHCGTASCR